MLKNSRLFQIVALICFTIVWTFVTHEVAIWADQPRFDDGFTLNKYQFHHWRSGKILKVSGGSDVFIRSQEENFTVYEVSGKYICTGTDLPTQPYDPYPTFECRVQPSVDTSYILRGYATITTPSIARLQMEKPLGFVEICVVSIVGTILCMSLLGLLYLIFVSPQLDQHSG